MRCFQISNKNRLRVPRPIFVVPPRGIGPISKPNENDVLSGRGALINAAEGNVQLRWILRLLRPRYIAPTTKKLEKAHIAASVVQIIRSAEPPGRFLNKDEGSLWYDIGDERAIQKVLQAFRELSHDKSATSKVKQTR